MSRLQNAVQAQYEIALDRKKNPAGEKSYTNYLYTKGLDTILKKCGEESFETVVAAKNGDLADLSGELNDLLYNLTVLLCQQEVTLSAVLSAVNVRCAVEGQGLDGLLEAVLRRKEQAREGSYTAYLFQTGLDKILKKVGESATDLLLAGKAENGEGIAAACGDLLYHLLVMMAAVGLSADAVAEEMERRLGKSGNLKTFRTTDLNS